MHIPFSVVYPSSATMFSNFSYILRYSSAPNGTLKIFAVQEGDEGSYQCIVENDKDMSLASGALLLGGTYYHYCLLYQ